jgi:hypothetical protein
MAHASRVLRFHGASLDWQLCLLGPNSRQFAHRRESSHKNSEKIVKDVV